MKTIVSRLAARFGAGLLLALALATSAGVAQPARSEARYPNGVLEREQLSYTNAVRDAANDLKQAIDRFERQKFDLSEQSLLRSQVWLDVGLKLLENHRPRISQVVPPAFVSQKSAAEKLMKKYLGIRNRIYSLQNEIDSFLPQLEAKLGRKSAVIAKARDMVKGLDPDKIDQAGIAAAVDDIVRNAEKTTGTSPEAQLKKMLEDAGLSAAEVQRFLEMFRNLTPAQQQALLNALAGLSPEELAKIAKALSQLSPEEFAKVAAALAKMNPADAQKALRELAKLTPEQAATALRAIAKMTPEKAKAALDTLATGDESAKAAILKGLGITGSTAKGPGSSTTGDDVVQLPGKDGTLVAVPKNNGGLNIKGTDGVVRKMKASDLKRSEVKREYIDEIGGQINKEEFHKLVVSADGKEGEYVSDGIVNWALDIVEVSKDGNKITYKVENSGDAGDQFKIERWELTVGSNKPTEGKGATFEITAPSGDYSVTAHGRTSKGDNEFRITKKVSQI